jgi:microcystin degradation protein MlrC
MHEVNGFADPVGLADGIDAALHPGGLADTWEAGALVTRLRSLCDLDIVDLPVWEFGASGPLDGDDFRAVVAGIVARLRAEQPLDALVVLGHGAGRTTDDLDPDATLFEALRAEVGPTVPIVVVLDFHANLSDRMCAAIDVVVGYRTNPHVDIAACLEEAAEHAVRLLDGPPTSLVWCHLPLALSQLAQLTEPAEPFGRVMALADRATATPVRNVSVFGGFALADVPDGGVSVCVTVDRGGEAHAEAVVRSLATALWDERPHYRLRATPLVDSVAIAAAASLGERAPVILADVADNPGGGAPGNTTAVMRALHEAGVQGAVMGLQCDPQVVAAAWHAGAGRTLRATFNAGSTRPLAEPFTVDARVVALVDASFVSTRGVYAGQRRHPGRSCALDLGGITVGVSARALQCADDDTLRHVGLDPASARVVVVKSRGHFRAGFDHLFDPDRIVEVEAPGVATPALHLLAWQHLQRPVFPLDHLDSFVPVVRRSAERPL